LRVTIFFNIKYADIITTHYRYKVASSSDVKHP